MKVVLATNTVDVTSPEREREDVTFSLTLDRKWRNTGKKRAFERSWGSMSSRYICWTLGATHPLPFCVQAPYVSFPTKYYYYYYYHRHAGWRYTYTVHGYGREAEVAWPMPRAQIILHTVMLERCANFFLYFGLGSSRSWNLGEGRPTVLAL